jgi:hypothetical protein
MSGWRHRRTWRGRTGAHRLQPRTLAVDHFGFASVLAHLPFDRSHLYLVGQVCSPLIQVMTLSRHTWMLRHVLGTRRATSTAVGIFAGNMDVVREESGQTDTGCARGLLLTGDSSQRAVVMHRSRVKTARYRRGTSVVKTYLTL